MTATQAGIACLSMLLAGLLAGRPVRIIDWIPCSTCPTTIIALRGSWIGRARRPMCYRCVENCDHRDPATCCTQR